MQPHLLSKPSPLINRSGLVVIRYGASLSTRDPKPLHHSSHSLHPSSRSEHAEKKHRKETQYRRQEQARKAPPRLPVSMQPTPVRLARTSVISPTCYNCDPKGHYLSTRPNSKRTKTPQKTSTEAALDHVPGIQYPVKFRKDQSNTQRPRRRNPPMPQKRGPPIRKTDVEAEKLNGSTL